LGRPVRATPHQIVCCKGQLKSSFHPWEGGEKKKSHKKKVKQATKLTESEKKTGPEKKFDPRP